jgi:periplasmic protein TonB
MDAMNDRSLALPLLSSLLLHGLAIACAAMFIHHSVLGKAEFFTVQLLELPPPRESSEPSEEKKPAAAPRVLKPKPLTPAFKSDPAKLEPPVPPKAKNDEIAQTIDTKMPLPPKVEAPTVPTTSRVEGGGSESGVSTFGQGEAGLPAGSNGGGGSAPAGLGRGSGAPGLPAQQPVLRTNRIAKPIQSVRPVYPPLALKMGMEGDVTLKIIVDPEGNVSRAEIVRSSGTDFIAEALKAVKQSRFEPAQRDGQNVAAEFTYIYRFRLQR